MSTYITYNTNIILTFTFTLHCSYLHYLYKQTGRALTLLTILKLYLHLNYIALLILTLFISANRTSTYITYNTNIILIFTLHCTDHTYTIYISKQDEHLHYFQYLYYIYIYITFVPAVITIHIIRYPIT